MPDLTAAADRVRRWKRGDWLSAIYPEAKDHAMAVAALEVDWRDLALAYVALHGGGVTCDGCGNTSAEYTRFVNGKLYCPDCVG